MSIPILMYHSIGGQSPTLPWDEFGDGQLYHLSTQLFRQHMACLRAAGFHGVTVRDWHKRLAHPTDAVILTFDDGFLSHRDTVLPILEEFQFTATFFVPVAYVGSSGMMDTAGLRHLAQAGMEVGAHGFHHQQLDRLQRGELRDELSKARSELSTMLDSEVYSMSVPGGFFSQTVAEVADEVGYRAVCTSQVNYATREFDGLAVLPRFPVKRYHSWRTISALADRAIWPVWKDQILQHVGGVAKRVMGTQRYEWCKGMFSRADRPILGPSKTVVVRDY